MVWQTMKIVDELQYVIGYAPKRVFVEVTRGDGEKERTTSRKQKLIDLYKSIKGEAKDWIKEIKNRENLHSRAENSSSTICSKACVCTLERRLI